MTKLEYFYFHKLGSSTPPNSSDIGMWWKIFGDVYPQDETFTRHPSISRTFQREICGKPTREVVPDAAALGNALVCKGWKTASNGDH
jgi:hypothetical protein